jgi:hypothetical protein
MEIFMSGPVTRALDVFIIALFTEKNVRLAENLLKREARLIYEDDGDAGVVRFYSCTSQWREMVTWLYSP